jgi:hypothetical protein
MAPRNTIRLAGAAGTLLLALSGCTSGPTAVDARSSPNVPAPASPTSDTSKPVNTKPSASTIATPKSSPRMNAGAVQGTSVVDVTTMDGFQAKVTLTWHEIQPMDEAEIKAAYPSCQTIMEDMSASSMQQHRLRGMVVEGTAVFATVNGVAWPAAKQLTVSAPSAFPVYDSCSDGIGSAPSNASYIGTTPVRPTFSYVLYELGAVNPKFPQGDFQADGYRLSFGNNDLDCVADGVTVTGCAIAPK